MRPALKNLLYKGAAAAGSVGRAVGLGQSDVAVLIYHSVSDRDGSITVPPPLFHEQLRWLRDHFEIISLDAALERPKDSPKAVVLTFDDGYVDYLRTAVPILVKNGIPSVVYVITELLERPETVFAFSSGRGMEPMNRQQVESLAREELVTVGSHSHRHQRFVGQPAEVLEEDFGASRSFLTDLLGRPEIHFAFPWGVGDRRAMLEAKRHFRSVAVGGSRGNRVPIDPFMVRRIPVKREELGLFAHRVRGDLLLEGVARSFRDRIVATRERREE